MLTKLHEVQALIKKAKRYKFKVVNLKGGRHTTLDTIGLDVSPMVPPLSKENVFEFANYILKNEKKMDKVRGT